MKKIGNKISLVIAICSCVAVLILGGLSIAESSVLVRRDAEEKLEWMAREYAAQFSNGLNLIIDNVAEMEIQFRDTFEIERLRSEPGYLAEYEQELADYLFKFASRRATGIAAWCYFNPVLSDTPHDVYFVDEDTDGVPDRQNYIPFSYYDGTPTPTDDKLWWYGPIETKSGFWTNPYEWTLKNGEIIKVVSYAQPIFIDGELIAVIGTYYHMSDMLQQISEIKVYESGYASLYNEKLDVIIHPEYSPGTRYTSDNLRTVEDGKYAELCAELLAQDYGSIFWEESGERELMAYGKLSNGWVLGISPVESEMMASVTLLTRRLVTAVALCILLSVAAAWILGLRIARPLREVVRCAKRIGTGDLEVRIEVDTRDEIKTVAESLNEMVEKTKLLQGKLSRLAYYDDLTGIPNMNLFKLNVQKLLEEGHAQFAYVILDVNKFKVINDVFGYLYGDRLLRHLAEALSLEFSEGETAARSTGDVFHSFCRFTSRSELEARLARLAEKISSFTFEAKEDYRISMCFGVYVVENTNLLVEMMGDYAGFAVKKIKNNYVTSVYFYNDDIRNRILEEQEIENDMQRGIDNREFLVYVQPKYALSTMQIGGGEALVRWQHPQKGFLPPDTFISVFEKNGFVTKLDMYVMDTVCRWMRTWMDNGLEPPVISVNQSRLHLNNPDYLSMLVAVLEKHQIPTHWIEIEITESVFFEDMEQMISIVNRLHALGFKISMDDFGSGYSSLNMLNSIAVDVLKIDRQFFNDSSNNLRGRKIVDNIISMASDLGIVVVAEGVETKEQVEFLQQTDCSLVQGYYFAKPMPLEQFEEKLREQT